MKWFLSSVVCLFATGTTLGQADPDPSGVLRSQASWITVITSSNPSNDRFKKALQLRDEQETELRQTRSWYNKEVSQIIANTKPRTGVAPELASLRRTYLRIVRTVLSDEQWEALQQLRRQEQFFHHHNAAALANDDYAAALHLTDEQIGLVRHRAAAAAFTLSYDIIALARQSVDEVCEMVLNDDQRKQLREMLGKPFVAPTDTRYFKSYVKPPSFATDEQKDQHRKLMWLYLVISEGNEELRAETGIPADIGATRDDLVFANTVRRGRPGYAGPARTMTLDGGSILLLRFAKKPPAKPEENEPKLDAFYGDLLASTYERATAELLPHQLVRLDQLRRQELLRGGDIRVLALPEFAEALGLNDEQLQHLQEVASEAQQQLDEKVQTLKHESLTGVFQEVLTADQLSNLREMLGDVVVKPRKTGRTPLEILTQ